MSTLGEIIQLMRPKEWVKNLFVFAALIFSGQLTQTADVHSAITAFLIFCLASSAAYVLNDLLDAKSDAHHPAKKHRPLPSGRIQPTSAVILTSVLTASSLFFASKQSMEFFTIVGCYLGLSLLYSAYLKRKVIVDVLAIAGGFVLRVLGGAVIIGVQASQWLILCTFLLATFLGFSKRRHELVQLGDSAKLHRWVLKHYSTEFLDHMNVVTITLTLTCYIFYTIAPETIARFGTSNLLYSVVLVMFGLFRYLFLVHQKGQGSPVEALYTDRQILLIILLWTIYMVFCIYTGPAVAGAAAP